MSYERGTVKFFNPAKGYGFITPDAQRPDRKDFFFHISGAGVPEESCNQGLITLFGGTQEDGGSLLIQRERTTDFPKEGDRLVFSIGEGKDGKGPAVNNWTTETQWGYALKIISERKDPAVFAGRILLQNKVVWEGREDEIRDHLSASTYDLGTIRVEVRTVRGWQDETERFRPWDDEPGKNGADLYMVTEEELLRGLEGLAPSKE